MVKTIDCSIVAVDLKSIESKLLCKNCKLEVTSDDGIVMCDGCEIMCLEEECNKVLL